jgi:hypothetical protein
MIQNLLNAKLEINIILCLINKLEVLQEILLVLQIVKQILLKV